MRAAPASAPGPGPRALQGRGGGLPRPEGDGTMRAVPAARGSPTRQAPKGRWVLGSAGDGRGAHPTLRNQGCGGEARFEGLDGGCSLLAGPRRNLKPWGRPAPPGGRRRGENRGPGARTCGSRLRLARPMKGRRSPWVWRCSGGGHTHALRRSIAAPQREITRGPRGSVTSGRPNRQNCRPWRRACAVAQSFQHRPSARRVPPSCERRDRMRPALSRCLRMETDEPTGASPVPSAAPVSIMMPGGLRLRSAPPAPPRPR